MTSVFRLHPNDLYKKMVYLNYLQKDENFDFLDIFLEKYKLNINIYYKIISNVEEFKLKNILRFFNSRLLKIDEKIRLHYQPYFKDILYKPFQAECLIETITLHIN